MYLHEPSVRKWVAKFPWLVYLHPNEVMIETVDGVERVMIWFFPEFRFVDASSITWSDAGATHDS